MIVRMSMILDVRARFMQPDNCVIIQSGQSSFFHDDDDDDAPGTPKGRQTRKFDQHYIKLNYITNQ